MVYTQFQVINRHLGPKISIIKVCLWIFSISLGKFTNGSQTDVFNISKGEVKQTEPYVQYCFKWYYN